MKHKFIAGAFLFFALLFAQTKIAEAKETFLYHVEIPCEIGAKVIVTDSLGQKREIGEVVKLPTKSRWPSYTASAWGKPGTVCATAVNAMHILLSVEKGQGRTVSVIPKETIAPAAGVSAAIVISTKAGNGVWGLYAPTTGTPVTLRGKGLISVDNFPKTGDILEYDIFQKSESPYMLEIENNVGGSVTVFDPSGKRVIARVFKPVGGSGRFEGTKFQNIGQLRANHHGVICVSTCEIGKIGGFQIIPYEHAAESKEMQHTLNDGVTQWLIIRGYDPKTGQDTELKGKRPLFFDAFIPGSGRDDKEANNFAYYGRKSLVLADYGNGFERIKPVSGKIDDAFTDIKKLRIYYPKILF